MNSTPKNTSADSAPIIVETRPEQAAELMANLNRSGFIKRADPMNDLRSLNFPYLDQYFGIWAMEERAFLAGFDHIKRTNLQLHIQQVKMANEEKVQGDGAKSDNGDASSLPYAVIGVTKSGIAVVDVSGALMKYESSMTASTSTVALRRSLRALARNEEITAVMLKIDSPGGTVAGTSDAADDIAALAARKPTAAYIDDLTASAAYWLASQVGIGGISAGKTSLVGSIGTYAVVEDSSAQAAMEGIKVHVVKAGDFKGTGVEGTAVTAEQLANVQRIVNALNEDFLAGVSRGRRMNLEQVKTIADGRVHKAPEALKIGLIDYVESFDAAMTRLESRIPPQAKNQRAAGGQKSELVNQNSQENGDGCSVAENVEPARVDEKGPERKESQIMTPDNNTPAGSTQPGAQRVAATAKEMQAAFADDPQFAMDQLAIGATLLEAKAAHSELLKTKLRARDDELEKLRQQNSNSNQEHQQRGNNLRPLGSRTVGRGGAGARTATEELAGGGGNGKLGPSVMAFNDAVREKMKLLNYDRRQAVVAVASEDPDLHRAYLEETNTNPKSRALIEDRFAGMA